MEHPLHLHCPSFQHLRPRSPLGRFLFLDLKSKVAL